MKKKLNEAEATVIKSLEVSQQDKVDAISRFSRDEFGLLSNVNYIFNEDGSVNWKEMIKPEFLAPNRDKFGADVDTKTLDVTLLEDNQLIILLAGIKDIAQIRGFKEVKYTVVQASHNYVAVECNIKWIANYETGESEISFGALADAHYENTNQFGQQFLMAIAENRAFTRAVRNFLRINIVGQDELSGDKKKAQKVEEDEQPTNPVTVLRKTMADAGLTFDKIREKLVKEGNEAAIGWNTEADIPRIKIFEIIERIKNKKKT